MRRDNCVSCWDVASPTGCEYHANTGVVDEPSGTNPTPYVCPVCSGRQTVAQGFYDGIWMSSQREDCRSCDGTGIVWQP
jgi:DnaJ-class molecular chaperone